MRYLFENGPFMAPCCRVIGEWRQETHTPCGIFEIYDSTGNALACVQRVHEMHEPLKYVFITENTTSHLNKIITNSF